MNLQELGLLLVLVAVAILTYSSLVYFAEKEVPEGIKMISYDHESSNMSQVSTAPTGVQTSLIITGAR